MSPDFLAIGHVARDVTPEGFRIGGAVTYGSITALRLGLKPAVVTSAEAGLGLEAALPGVQVHVLPASGTTTFHNLYSGGRRSQTLSAVGGPIGAADIPPQWRSAPLVLLGPLARELDHGLARAFPRSIVVASIQGWLRQWDAHGRVTPACWDGKDVLPNIHAAIVSRDDVGDPGLIELWKGLAQVLIVTQGAQGARLHLDGRWHHVPAFPTKEVDPSGAGDVFAAAYLVRYRETGDPLASARFASCAASFCVEAEGTAGIATWAQVEARLRGMG